MIEVLKYFTVGLSVSLIAFLCLKERLTFFEIILIGLVALITHVIIDTFPILTQSFGFIIPLEPPHNTLPQNETKPHIQRNDEIDEVPYKFSKSHPEEPIPSVPSLHPYSGISGIASRWMNWSESNVPINQNTEDYKLYPGMYASLHVRPGFDDKIEPANIDHSSKLSPHIWDTTNPLDTRKWTYQGLENHMTGGGDANENPEPRLTNVVYSGDLIELSSGENTIQRATTNSQVLLDTPLPKIRTNLSKLRLENILSTDSHSPIKYRQNIYIKHNALIDNMNQIRFIKYGERLQSHQEGPTYEMFKLYNKESPESNDYVKYGDNFLIACGDQVGDKVFLKVEADHTISSEAIKNDAITFNLSLTKPHDSTSLCICTNETIYP